MSRISSLLLLLASLCSLGLSSCVSTDLPIALNSIGREYAVIARENYKPRQMPEIYRLGDSYYMKLDLKYLPTEFGLLTWNSLYDSESVFTFNKRTQQLYDSAPVETHMVLLSDNGKKELLGIDAEAVTPTTANMIPVAEFDFAHATRCTPKQLTGMDPSSMLSSYGYLELEPRCSALNVALKPLSWASWAVEIPFVIATNTVIWSVALPTSQIMAAAQQQQTPARTRTTKRNERWNNCGGIWRTEGERKSKARTCAGDRELAQSKRAKARAALGKEKIINRAPQTCGV